MTPLETKLAEALRSIERCCGDDADECPRCFYVQEDGHASNCPIAWALAEYDAQRAAEQSKLEAAEWECQLCGGRLIPGQRHECK